MEVIEEGIGQVQLTTDVPKELRKFLIHPSRPLVLIGRNIKALMLEFAGEGFSAWYNRFWAKGPVILRARDARSVLELRVGWRNQIKGSWERVKDPGMPPKYFQMAFTPHVSTRAIFEAPLVYQTFDVHFDLSFLIGFGLDYQLMDQFIRKVDGQQAAELAPRPYPCSGEMLQLIQFILNSDHSDAGKKRQLVHHIHSILTAALETVSVEEGVHLPLTRQNKEALNEIAMHLQYCPIEEYPGTDQLLLQTTTVLPPFKFAYGFKRQFGCGPEEYFLRRRFTEAQALLAQGYNVTHVAYVLGYTSPKTFIKEFHKRFGTTPGKWSMQ